MNERIAESGVDLEGIGELERLEANVMRRLARRIAGFRLLVRGQGLVLQGRADTFYAKQLAQHAVMNATGLPILANEIRVI